MMPGRAILFLLVGITLLMAKLHAEPSREDSLKQRLPHLEGRELLAALERLGVIYYRKQVDSALAYTQKLRLEAERQGNRQYLASALATQGLCLSTLGMPDSSLALRRRALRIYEEIGDSQNISRQYLNTGSDFMSSGLFDSALHYTLTGLRIERKIAKPALLGNYLGNLGTLYAYLSDYERAQQYYRLEIRHGMESGDSFSLLNGYGGMANSSQTIGRVDSARFFYHQAQQLALRLNAKPELAAIMAGQGALNYDLEIWDSAAYYSLQAASAYQELGRVFLRYEMDYQAAPALFLAGKSEEAKGLLRNALVGSRQMKAAHLEQRVLFSLSDLLEREDSLAQAMKLFKAATSLKDSLLGIAKQERIAELETQYETERTRHNLIEARRQAQVDRLSAQLAVLYALLGIILLGTLAFFLWQRLQKQKKSLATTKEQLQKSQEEGLSLKQAIEKRNNELTIQTLSIIRKNASLKQAREELSNLEATLPEQRAELRKLQRLVADGLSSERDWAYLELAFDQVGDGFFKRLRSQYPRLSTAETRLCALAHLQLSIKDSASLLNISPNSVKVARSRLKKKLGLVGEENLDQFLTRL